MATAFGQHDDRTKQTSASPGHQMTFREASLTITTAASMERAGWESGCARCDRVCRAPGIPHVPRITRDGFLTSATPQQYMTEMYHERRASGGDDTTRPVQFHRHGDGSLEAQRSNVGCVRERVISCRWCLLSVSPFRYRRACDQICLLLGMVRGTAPSTSRRKSASSPDQRRQRALCPLCSDYWH